jgi:hypothetical protein
VCRCKFGVFGLFGVLVVETEADVVYRCCENGNRSRNRKTKKPTFRFGSARFGIFFGFGLKVPTPTEEEEDPEEIQGESGVETGPASP